MRLPRFALFVVLLVAQSLCALPAGAASEKIILVFGDSLSAGYGIAQDKSWPTLLAKKLRADKSPYTVVNASISGETTAGGLARLPHTLQTHHPAIVVIELGGNDGLRGLPLDAMRANLVAMIRAARNAKAKVLLVGMKLPPNYGLDYTAQFAQSFADIAAREKTAFLPFLLEPIAGRREAFQADDLHPVADVQPLLLAHVSKALTPLFKESR